ncbi:sulfotransferase [Thalassomonas sp. M1454]|uniref:sulfotransferase n=1 Tax=Thalassomonas sp. M1454 TaxID=2594477 RepID=UPI00117EFA95|nr:sulfotransferase [Thalassomonas sp. M1454]TRX57393.1 sulfotransferase [Thalassomonas sp. M1454]
MKVNKDILDVVVTGMEYSGTTLLGNLLNSAMPHSGGAFECGLLLAQSPINFSNQAPFYDWFSTTETIGHWGLSITARNEIISQDNFQLAYTVLAREYSKVCGVEVRKIIDKTPAYAFNLISVTSKIDTKVPLLITYKDIYSLYHSYKKRKRNLWAFSYWLNKFIFNLKSIHGRKNVLIISQASMAVNPDAVLKKLSLFFHDIELNSVGKLNYKLNPLKKNYSLEQERIDAKKGLNPIEKIILQFFDFRLRRVLVKFEVI